ncbi:MAG: Na+/H+ antiporter subunit D, partial [Desulfobacterales bacterium]
MKRSSNIALSGAVLQLIACGTIFDQVHRDGIFASQMGNWPAPFGITLVADHLSAVMVVITAVINLAVVAYSRADIGATLVKRGYYPLMQTLLGGICGAF